MNDANGDSRDRGPFTDEMRKKSIATRKRRAAERKMRRMAAEAGVTLVPDAPVGFDYEHAPLQIASERLSTIKREYDRGLAIIEQRRHPADQHQWVCWTQNHLDLVPAGMKYQGESVRAKCLKGGDGVTKLPKFIDDGNFETIDGVKVRRSVYCCNFLCYQIYQRHRVTPPTMQPLNLKEPAHAPKGV